VKTLGFDRSRRLASPLLISTVMLLHLLLEGADLPAALLVIAAMVIALVMLLGDDDLPGPRRCFARTPALARARS
jgi:hypothetical protein